MNGVSLELDYTGNAPMNLTFIELRSLWGCELHLGGDVIGAASTIPEQLHPHIRSTVTGLYVDGPHFHLALSHSAALALDGTGPFILIPPSGDRRSGSNAIGPGE